MSRIPSWALGFRYAFLFPFYGCAPIRFDTPLICDTIGVLTGAASPTSCVIEPGVLLDRPALFATHTFPEASMATACGPCNPGFWNPPAGDSTAPVNDTCTTASGEGPPTHWLTQSAVHAEPAPSIATMLATPSPPLPYPALRVIDAPVFVSTLNDAPRLMTRLRTELRIYCPNT